MAKASTKTLTMVVKVRVPVGMTPTAARREVRTLINQQSNWSADPEDIRVLEIRPAPSAH